MKDENIDLLVEVYRSLRKNLEVMNAIYKEEKISYKLSYEKAIKEDPEDPDYDDTDLVCLANMIDCIKIIMEEFPYNDEYLFE